MKIWRHLLTSFILFSLLLTACNPSTLAPANSAPSAESSGTSAEANTATGNVEIWHFWGSPARRTAIRRVVALCEEQLPGIDITETFKPWGDIWTANVAAVAAGSGMPDIIVEDRPQLPQRARDQIVTDLQPYIDRDHFNTEDYWPFTWLETLYEGDSYGILFETDARVLIWNKQAFADAGLDPAQPPWDELETYADALLLIFLAFQRYFIEGVTITGMGGR